MRPAFSAYGSDACSASTTQPAPFVVHGLGDVVNVGVAHAMANAVFNATGRRIRGLPITAEALL